MHCLRRTSAICRRALGRVFYSVLQVRSERTSFVKDEVPPPHVTTFPRSKYGGEYIVTLLTGDTAVGKQGASFIATLFDTAKVPVSFERIKVDAPDSRSDEFLQSVMRNRSALLVDLHHDPNEKAKITLVNTQLDLYACVINLNSFAGFNCRHQDLDIMLVIQNNNGDFSKLEYEPVPGMVETLRIAEAKADRRYLEFVFEHALKSCRKKITFGHKTTALPRSDGKFIEIATQLGAEKYPQIKIEFVLIDQLVLDIIMAPQQFDVICANDRYGTFLASIASGVCGGASLFSATELGDHHAIFKPLQTKLSITDCHSLSPYGIVRASIDLLNYLGNTECANTMWTELMHTMLDLEVKTPEFGGSSSGEYVICNLVNDLKCKFA